MSSKWDGWLGLQFFLIHDCFRCVFSSNWRTLMRNGTETNKGFGPVVVVICGHTIVLVTQLVLRVPLGKPCDTYLHAGTRCRYVLPGCSLVVSASCTRMGCILYRRGYDSGHTMLTL